MHMNGKKKLHNKKAMTALLIVLGIALVCFIGVVAAKYISSSTYSGSQIGAKDFYFAIDSYLEDDQDENKIVTKDVHLYGTTQNSYTFHVQNYFDPLRVNSENILFSVDCGPATGVVLTEGDGTEVAQSYSLVGGSCNSQDFKVTFNDLQDERIAEIAVTSTSPYAKTMVLKVHMHPNDYDVLYRVEDEAGKAYAKLVVMAGVDVAAQALNIDWSAVNAEANLLQIDSTDSDVLNQIGIAAYYKDGLGSYMVKATNDHAIAAGGSLAIYFFKADPSDNYAKSDTAVTLSDGKYSILITEN